MAGNKQSGRKKQPAQVKDLAGWPDKTSKADQVKQLELMIPNKGSPMVPAHLHEEAQACIEVIKDSMPDGVYSRLDTYLLTAFACAWATHVRASHEMSNPDFQYLTKAPRGMVMSPWIKLMFTAGDQMAKLSDRLGLNPSTRQGLRLPTTLEARDPYEDLIALNASSSSFATTSKSHQESV
jgi:phage terminase small subunit